MNKQDYAKQMNYIKSATLKQGLKWDKKQMRIAQEMILARQKPKEENWQGEKKIELIGDVLKNLRGIK